MEYTCHIDSVLILRSQPPGAVPRANRPLAVILSIAYFEEKVLKKGLTQCLETLSGAMDVWRKQNRRTTASVDAVQAVRKSRDER